MSRLQYVSHDGKSKANIGHGAKCVVIYVENEDGRPISSIVLTSNEAKKLGKAIVQQARWSEG